MKTIAATAVMLLIFAGPVSAGDVWHYGPNGYQGYSMDMGGGDYLHRFSDGNTVYSQDFGGGMQYNIPLPIYQTPTYQPRQYQSQQPSYNNSWPQPAQLLGTGR